MAVDDRGGSGDHDDAVRLAALLEAIEAIPDGFVLYDAGDRLVLNNGAFRALNADVADVIRPGIRFADLLEAKATASRRALDGGSRRRCGVDCAPACDEWRGCRQRAHGDSHGVMFETTPDGRWVRVDEHRTPSGMTVGIRTDLSDLRDVQQQLARSEAKFRTLFAMAPIGIVRTTADGRIVDANPAFAVITGSSPDDRRLLPDLFDPRDREAVAADLAKAAEVGDHGPVERRLVAPDGGEVVLSLEGTRAVEEDGTVFLWSILRDVTERSKSEARIWHAAHHDPLTGLPNRKYLGELLADRLDGVDEVALLLIDLDNFKQVNDTLGHETGDAVLRATAERLRAGLRAGDVVARLGGDEFAAVLAGPIGLAEARALGERLIEAIGRDVVHRDHAIRVGGSIGIASVPQHGCGADDLLGAADLALFAAKRAGRNRAVIFAPAMQVANRRRFEILSGAREALAEGRIVPFYQPIVAFDDGAVIGFEALCRVESDDGVRSFSPEVFGHTDLGRTLDERMIDLVTADMAAWRAAGHVFGRVAVNVCDADFSRQGFDVRLFERLEARGLEASMLELEVTETALLEVADGSLAAGLDRLRAGGIALALDDFGTGHASLVHLKTLPVDRVKIDRSFVSDVVFDTASRAIVGALTRLGRGLGKEVVAEGVETEGQHRALVDLGCRCGQGHLYGRPMPAAAATRLLETAERAGAAARVAVVGKRASHLR